MSCRQGCVDATKRSEWDSAGICLRHPLTVRSSDAGHPGCLASPMDYLELRLQQEATSRPPRHRHRNSRPVRDWFSDVSNPHRRHRSRTGGPVDEPDRPQPDRRLGWIPSGLSVSDPGSVLSFYRAVSRNSQKQRCGIPATPGTIAEFERVR